MCKANGRQWSKYRESDRCQAYLDALAETSEIRMFNLIESDRRQRYLDALESVAGISGHALTGFLRNIFLFFPSSLGSDPDLLPGRLASDDQMARNIRQRCSNQSDTSHQRDRSLDWKRPSGR